MHVPYAKNVDGDFYVEDGCCMSCGVPHDVAPEHFAWDEYPNEFWPGKTAAHCFVSRQPSTDAEVARMLAAMRKADLDCIRYRGSDPDIIRRLAGMGLAGQCDVNAANR